MLMRCGRDDAMKPLLYWYDTVLRYFPLGHELMELEWTASVVGSAESALLDRHSDVAIEGGK